jgi:hypothetical protein
MLSRDIALRALKRELEKTPVIHLPLSEGKILDFLFVYIEPADPNLLGAARDLVQKMGEALKLPRERWDLLPVSDGDAQTLNRKTAGFSARFLVFLGTSEGFRLSGADFIEGASVEDLLRDISKKREVWEKLKAALGRL